MRVTSEETAHTSGHEHNCTDTVLALWPSCGGGVCRGERPVGGQTVQLTCQWIVAARHSVDKLTHNSSSCSRSSSSSSSSVWALSQTRVAHMPLSTGLLPVSVSCQVSVRLFKNKIKWLGCSEVYPGVNMEQRMLEGDQKTSGSKYLIGLVAVTHVTVRVTSSGHVIL